jgi:acyl-CoA synthetase (AMP-forming)/AMP-acid ligase II
MNLVKPVPHPTTIAQLLEIGATQATAIAGADRPGLSYGGLRKSVADAAQVISISGISRSDRIVIVLGNGPEAAVAFLAAASAGVACPLNPGLTAAEFEFTISDLAARVLFTAPGPSAARNVADKLRIPVLEIVPGDQAGAIDLVAINANDGNRAEWQDATSDHEALALHTSGTTARPKLVPLTHGNLCASARNISASLG